MATYNTSTYLKGARLRPADQFAPEEATFSYTYPDGKAVVSGDIINLGYLGENVQILEVEANVDTSLAASGVTLDVGTSATADCFIDGASFGNGAGTAYKVIDGLIADTSASAFADGHVVPSTSVLGLKATLAGTIGTAVTSGARTISVRFKFQRAYPEQIAIGAPNTYPGSGSITYGTPVTLTYNGNAP